MSKRLISLLSFALILGMVSGSYAVEVVIGDFESGLDGWFERDGTLSLSSTGATLGAQAMQVDGPGGWHIHTLLNLKPHRTELANAGATIMADVTAFEADMNTTWMQVEMVINAQNNDDAGANNNIGWQALGAQDVVRDGQPHTYTWALPDTLTAAIAGVDDNISWFELALVANLDGASPTKFYIDNIRLVYEEPTSSTVVGNWETDMEGWELAPDTPAASTTEFSTTGVTLGAQSLKVTIPEGGWKNAVRLNVNAQGLSQVFEQNHEFSIDVTRLAADWTGDPADGHSGIHFIINAGGDGWSIWYQSDYMGWWKYDQGDQTQTLTWDYTDAKPQMQFDNIWWLEIWIISNYDAAYTTGGVYYLDNARLAGAPIDTSKSTDFILGNWEQDLDRWVPGGTADVRYSDTNGVTLGNYSLDVYTPTGEWANALEMDLLAPENADILAAFRANTKVTADITHLVVDWPVDDIPPWNGTHLIINTDGAAVPSLSSGYVDLGYRAGWNQNNGDRTDSVTWDYSQAISDINKNFDKVTYLQLFLVVNANSADYTGWVWFYIDNMKLSGGGIVQSLQPASGARDVPVDTVLSWTPGAFDTTHYLYFGTNSAKVAAADMDSDPDVTFAVLDVNSFDPNGLEFNTQYFWRIDEVNDDNPDSPWTGNVVDFTTANFIVVDDFESYNAIDPGLPGSHRIFETWSDGYGDETNGALAGHDYLPYTEQNTVNNGIQSMPVYYDNTGAALHSEIQRVWTEPQDWTVNGFNALSLSTYGSVLNKPGELYIIIEDSAGNSFRVPNPDSGLFTAEEWAEWTIPLGNFAAAGVDTSAVTKLIIGVADLAGQAGANGLFYVDDIRVGFEPVGLVAYYALENNLDDSSGNGHDGTFGGDPSLPAQFVAGPTGFGQGLLFNGTGGHQNVEVGNFNPSAATGQLTIALWAKWNGPSDQWQGLIGKRDGWALDNMMWHLEVNRDTGTIAFARYDSYPNSGGATLPIGVWTHVAVTFDGTTARFYINGQETGNGGFSFGQDEESTLHFGSDDPNGGNAFNGALDEVRIYDIVLSPDEILQLAGK